jgi:hypothetical protein
VDFFGATAKLTALVPFGWGDWTGQWEGEQADASRRGFGDPAVSLLVNFVGAPALTSREMRTYSEGTIIGASLMAIIPLGQYDPDKLINLGSNRWAFRTRLGASRRIGRWIVETIGSVALFAENTEAFGGVSIEQDPLYSLQFNGIYHTRRGFWIGGGFGYGEGGQTTVSGQEKDTQQISRRLGATLVYPLSGRNSLKISYTNSLSTAIGADYDLIKVSWRFLLGGGA